MFGSDDVDIVFGFLDLQILCRKNWMNKYKVCSEGLILLIVDFLKNGEEVWYFVLSIFCLFVENDDDCKVMFFIF